MVDWLVLGAILLVGLAIEVSLMGIRAELKIMNSALSVIIRRYFQEDPDDA